MDFPKCLIISHNVIGLDGNMGKTLHAYFSMWPQDKLCQLYFHSEIPTTTLCRQYFRITDVDMVRGLFSFKRPGKELRMEEIDTQAITTRVDTGRVAELYQKGRQRKPWMYLARNTLWGLGLWKSKQLDEWIKSCKPEVIFYASGDYTFSFKIAQHISRKYQIPLVTSIVDDYYFHRKNNIGLLAKWNTWRFRKTMEETVKQSSHMLYIHPAMQRKYEENFLVNGAVLHSNAPIYDNPDPVDDVVRISYLGNLGYNRHLALKEIGQAIRRLVPDGSVLLDVYSSEPRQEILKHLTEENGIRFQGQISFDEVQQVIKDSNILVMAEYSDPEIQEQIRYSLSTKVSECLGSGRCLLAYGPAEAGSISYLLENKAGCVATNPQELEDKLTEIIFSPEARATYAKGQRELALRNHTPERNHNILYHALRTAVDETQR